MQPVRRHLTFSNVVAVLALFIALGGVSYGALKLPKNSVGTKQIKNQAITSGKIKNGAVTGAKIQAGTLGNVPSATRANTAVTADTAAKATSADRAVVADNANSLNGLPASAFLSSGSIIHGRGALSNSNVQIFDLGGITVSEKNNSIQDVVLKAAPGTEWFIASAGGSDYLVSSESKVLPFASAIETFWVRSADGGNRDWVINCMSNFYGEQIDCIAIGK